MTGETFKYSRWLVNYPDLDDIDINNKGINMDIKQLLEGLTAEQIKKVIATISQQGNIVKVDHTRKLRRIARTNLYFNSCPKPHQVDSFETYNGHADSIREQVLSGVE